LREFRKIKNTGQGFFGIEQNAGQKEIFGRYVPFNQRLPEPVKTNPRRF
jgi:hypothetical protein